MTDNKTADNTVDNTQKDPKDWVSGDDPMTGAQESYLKTLAEQAHKELPKKDLTKAEASELIDTMRQKPGSPSSEMAIGLAGGVKLRAFCRMFSNTCASRSDDARTRHDAGTPAALRRFCSGPQSRRLRARPPSPRPSPRSASIVHSPLRW